MDVSYDIAGTLRAQDHGHPPLILDAVENDGECNAPDDINISQNEKKEEA